MQAYLEMPVERELKQADLFRKVPPQKGLQVSVVVPVRNEAVHLPAALDALLNQKDTNGNRLPAGIYEVLVLANNCTDRSADIVARYQNKYPDFPLHLEDIYLPAAKANIGTVRRLLMDAACRRLNESGNPNGIIASTDGDTVVDSRWIYYITREIGRGNDAVGGRILTKPDSSAVRPYYLRDVMHRSLLARAEALLDPNLHDPWPCHFQYFGASLAVTCNMYQLAGRLPQVPYLEDSAFLQALNSVDAKVRKSNHVRVYTSTRTTGRVEVGFSEQLQTWGKEAAASVVQMVQPAEASLLLFKSRAAVRACRLAHLQNEPGSEELTAIAQSLFISPVWLTKQMKTSQFFGALWQQVEQKAINGKWGRLWKPVPITKAIEELRSFIRKHGKRLC